MLLSSQTKGAMSRRMAGNRPEQGQQCRHCMMMNAPGGAHDSVDDCITAMGQFVASLDRRLKDVENRIDQSARDSDNRSRLLEARLTQLHQKHDSLNQYVRQDLTKRVENPSATARVSSNNPLLNGLGPLGAVGSGLNTPSKVTPIGTRPVSNQQVQAVMEGYIQNMATGLKETSSRPGWSLEADRAGPSSQPRQESEEASYTRREHKNPYSDNKKPLVPPKPRLGAQHNNNESKGANDSNNNLRRAMSPQPYRPYRYRFTNHHRQQRQAQADPAEIAIVQFLNKHHRPTFLSNNVNCSGQHRNDGQLELIIEGGWQEDPAALGPRSYKQIEPRKLMMHKNTTCKQLHDALRPNNERATDAGELNLLFVQHRVVPECDKSLWSLGMRSVSHVLIVPDRIDFGDQVKLAYLRKGPNVSGNQMRRTVSEF